MQTRSRDRHLWRAGLLPLLGFVFGCADSVGPRVEVVLSEATVDFRAVRGTTTTISKTISVENGGDGRLGPVSCPANPAAWLACSTSNGNTITLTANPTGLATNPAQVFVPITAPGAGDKTGGVTVNLIIDQPVVTLSAATVNFTASEGGSAQRRHRPPSRSRTPAPARSRTSEPSRASPHRPTRASHAR